MCVAMNDGQTARQSKLGLYIINGGGAGAGAGSDRARCAAKTQ
jgi:hypothetical protein